MEEKERLWNLADTIKFHKDDPHQFNLLYDLINKEFETANSIQPAKWKNYAWCLNDTITKYANDLVGLKLSDKSFRDKYKDFVNNFKDDVLSHWGLQP